MVSPACIGRLSSTCRGLYGLPGGVATCNPSGQGCRVEGGQLAELGMDERAASWGEANRSSQDMEIREIDQLCGLYSATRVAKNEAMHALRCIIMHSEEDILDDSKYRQCSVILS